MGIDSSIPLSVQPVKVESPLNALAQALQAQAMQQQTQLGRMTLDEKQRSIEQTNKLNQLYASAIGADGQIDRNALFRGAAQQGLGSQIPGLQKTFQEADKSSAELQKARTDTMAKKAGMYRDALSAVTNPQDAAQWLAAQYQDPDMKGIFPMPLNAALSSIPQDPAGFQQWVQKQALGMGKFIEQNAPKTNVVNTGATTQIVQTPGLGGAPTVAGTIQNTQSPDSRARLAQERNLASQGVSYEADNSGNFVALPKQAVPGQTIVARSVVGPDGKPIQSNKGAPTEFQGKSATFGARAEAADKTLTELTGKYSPAALGMKQGAGNIWAVGGALEAGGNLMLSKEAQKAEQAMRDFVNAVLRQESGAAISQSEFDNAKRQYFPQPGDSADVIAQKARNRQIAIEGFKRNAGRAAWNPDSIPTRTNAPMPNLTNGGIINFSDLK